MWRAHGGPELPPGYSLMEDEDVLYLYQGEKLVAGFSAKAVDPEVLKEEIRKAVEAELPR